MKNSPIEHSSRWSRPVLVLLIAVTVGLLLALVWIDFTWRATVNAIKLRDLRVKELQGQVVHLDELLTMSAMMAATSGDEAWEYRYRANEPLLTAALEEVLLIAPEGAASATSQTGDANSALIAIENEAFELARAGKLEEAQAILASSEYAEQKRVYSAGMTALDQALDHFIAESHAETLRSGQAHLTLNLGAVVLVTIGWSIFFGNMLRSEKALAVANESLEKHAAKLAHANADLAESNLHLCTEVETRIEAEAAQKELHKKLLAATHQAGMAEVATGVLHNVGNALNSVNVSASLAIDLVKNSRVTDLEKATGMLAENSLNLPEFLTSHPRGQLLIPYLIKLVEKLQIERNELREHLEDLCKNIDHTKEIVKSQQTYARVSNLSMEFDLCDVVEDVLKTLGASLRESGIELVKDWHKVPTVHSDKHKVMQILANLITNAIHALLSANHLDKKLIVRIAATSENMVSVEVRDNGIGIDEAHLIKIFQYGFTTKQTGHGFGLHHSALVAREMGGEIRVHSEGLGQGACFILEIPIEREEGNLSGDAENPESKAETAKQELVEAF